MNIIRETSIINVKNKMTDIRRQRKGLIYHNYYNNCDNCEVIYAVYGKNTIVLWSDDNDVTRGYFYSSDTEELSCLLSFLPKNCIVDYVTKNKDELRTLFESSGLKFLYEMHRMSYAKITEDEKKIVAENQALMMESLYRPQNARCALCSDLDYLYDKLYEIFDRRESHLPTKNELLEFIENRWVAIYCENNKIMGFQIFKVEKGQFYGYQIWNGTGPESYFTLNILSNQLYEEYLAKNKIDSVKVRPSYCWVNVKNRKNMRLVKFWGQKFDGLYDFVYEKI